MIKVNNSSSYLILLIMLFYSGCTNSPESFSINEKSKYIDILKYKCNRHELSACYEAGQYYLNKKNRRLALIYFNTGCIDWERKGFINKKIIERTDMNSCIEEAQILKDNNLIFYDSFITSIKFRKVADFYYKKNDLKKAKEYYLLSLPEMNGSHVYYRLSQIALIEKDYSLSKKYYTEYVIYNGLIKNSFMFSKAKLHGKVEIFEYKIVLESNGTISDFIFIKSSNINSINEMIKQEVENSTYYSIPSEFNLEKMTISVKVQY